MGRTVKAPESDLSLIKERRATLPLFFHSPFTAFTMRLLKSSLLFVALLFLVHLVHLAAAAGGRGQSSPTSKSPKHDRDKAHFSATAGDASDGINFARMPRDHYIQLRTAYNDELFHLSEPEIKHLRELRGGEPDEDYKELHEAATKYREALNTRLNAIKSDPVLVLSQEAFSKNELDVDALQRGLEKEWIPVLLKRVKNYLPIDEESDPWELSEMDVETRMKSYRIAVLIRQHAEQREESLKAWHERKDKLLHEVARFRSEHEKKEKEAERQNRERRGGGGQTSAQGRAGSTKSWLHRCHLDAVAKWEEEGRREVAVHTELEEGKKYTGPPLPIDESFFATQPSRKLVTELRNKYNAEFLKCMTEGATTSSDNDFRLQMDRTYEAAQDYSKVLGNRLDIIFCNIGRLEVGPHSRNTPGPLREFLLEFEMEKESLLLIQKKLKVALPILPEDELPITIKKMTTDQKKEKLAELKNALEKRKEEEHEEAVLEEKGIENTELIVRRHKETELLKEALRVQARTELKERTRNKTEGLKEGLRDQAGPSA